MKYYSEKTFYTEVGETTINGFPALILKTPNVKESLILGQEYVDKMLDSSSDFKSEKKVSRTELLNTLKQYPFTACTVFYNKAVKEESNVERMQKFFTVTRTDKEVKEFHKSLISGEERTLVGHYVGTETEHGRLNFFDVEASGNRQADPRTIQWLIIKGTKYIVK